MTHYALLRFVFPQCTDHLHFLSAGLVRRQFLEPLLVCCSSFQLAAIGDAKSYAESLESGHELGQALNSDQ